MRVSHRSRLCALGGMKNREGMHPATRLADGNRCCPVEGTLQG